jgi:hypothetical protein
MSINEAINHDWVKGSKILLEEKEKCGNTSIFLSYLLTDHIKNFNNYVNVESKDNNTPQRNSSCSFDNKKSMPIQLTTLNYNPTCVGTR